LHFYELAHYFVDLRKNNTFITSFFCKIVLVIYFGDFLSFSFVLLIYRVVNAFHVKQFESLTL